MATLVNRSEVRPLDAVGEGEYVRETRWVDRFDNCVSAVVGPLRMRSVEMNPFDCVLVPEWGEARVVRLSDLPPRLVRGVHPPVDCPHDDCSRCWVDA